MNKCIICQANKQITFSLIYDSTGGSHKIYLCHLHDIELFRVGQISFLSKYKVNKSTFEESFSEKRDQE